MKFKLSPIIGAAIFGLVAIVATSGWLYLIGVSTCPLEALERWLWASGITEGTVFRSIDRSGRISNAGLSGHAISVILKRRLKQTGCDPSDYSGHSLRAGFVTEAVNAGIPPWKIRP